MLHRLHHIPKGLLDCPADRLLSIIPGATLLSLEGRRKEPLFLSVLLHGNETTGLLVAQNILKKYGASNLPRTLLLFIGNVKAASENKRRLDGQPDFNRIWRPGETAEHRLTSEILRDMSARKPFASIDIHNNTGISPHYACINSLDYRFINMARRFSRTVIYFVRPLGVQSRAFAQFCPAVTLECGRVGDEYGIQLATRFADEILNSDGLSGAKVEDHEIDLFHTTAIIKIPETISTSFKGKEADIQFIKGFENLNFTEIPPRTNLARMRRNLADSITVLNEEGKSVADELFDLQDGQLINRKPLMPSMLTPNEKIIHQDCLCYIMERYQIGMGEKVVSSDRPVWVNF